MSLSKHQVLTFFKTNTTPYGLTYKQWIIKWWKWLLKIPVPISPTMDETGNNAYIGQDDSNVFFLCQTFEQTGVIPSRIVSIHKGMSLFLPLINWISVFPEDGITDEGLSLKARAKMNTIADLAITINGTCIKNLKEYRLMPGPFHVELPENNILNSNPGSKRVVSDGYWIMTYPIMEPIRLKTFGSCTAGLTRIGVNYDIRTF